MRGIFEKLENCHHRPLDRAAALVAPGINPSRHGWNGWLQTETAIPRAALGSQSLIELLLKSAHAAFDNIGQPIEQAWELAESQADPNDWRLVQNNAVGCRYAPLATRNHARMGTRERALEVAAAYPDRLKIELNALATRILFDDTNRAIGVEYLSGDRQYRAHVNPSDTPGNLVQAKATRESSSPLAPSTRRNCSCCPASDRVPTWTTSASKFASICRASAAIFRTATKSA